MGLGSCLCFCGSSTDTSDSRSSKAQTLDKTTSTTQHIHIQARVPTPAPSPAPVTPIPTGTLESSSWPTPKKTPSTASNQHLPTTLTTAPQSPQLEQIQEHHEEDFHDCLTSPDAQQLVVTEPEAAQHAEEPPRLVHSVLGPRDALPPLDNPESVLDNMAEAVSQNDLANILAALLLLRCAIRHHSDILAGCKTDIIQLLTDCITTISDESLIPLAALITLQDYIIVLGNNILSCVNEDFLRLLLRLACSTKLPKQVSKAADAVLRTMAETLHQSTILALLEVFLLPGERPKIKAVARKHHIIATYRLN